MLYEHIREHRPEKVLELGTARAGSAVFIAAALEENGTGTLTSVESLRWKRTDPSPQEVLDAAGLQDRVTLDASFSTYTWFLKREVERNLNSDGSVRSVYDLIFLDGAKNWSIDGLAVVLMERLLKPGGWLLLDDLGWSYERNIKSTRHYSVELDTLSEEERTEPHLRAIFDLLIRTNPVFDHFVVQDDWWGWARKTTDPSLLARGGVLTSNTRTDPLLRKVWRRVPPVAQQRIRTLRSRLQRR